MSVYPEATAWDIHGAVMLIGSNRPLVIDHQRVSEHLQRQPLSDRLASTGLRGPSDVYGRYLAGSQVLRHIAGDGPLTTDDRPLTEFERATDTVLGDSARRQLAGHKQEILDLVIGLSPAERMALARELGAGY